jgi:Two component regulator propeller
VRRVLSLGLLMLAGLAAGGRPAVAAGGWDSWLYPGYFSDLLATRNEVWCATREGGLLRWDRRSGAFDFIGRAPGSILSNQLTSLAMDRSGRLWVGTADAGVARLRSDRSGWEAVNTFDGLPSNSVTKLLAVGDTVWIGTDGGVALWDGQVVRGALPDGFTFSFDSTFADLSVRGIAVFGDSVFLATRSGVGMAHLSKALGDWRPVNAGLDPTYLPVEDMVGDGQSLLLVGNPYCYRFDFASQTWQFERGDGLMLARGASSVLLTATSGIYRWDGSTFDLLPGSPRPVPKPSDSYRDFMRATDDSNGTVFAGSANVFTEQTGPGSWLRHDLSVPPDNSIYGVATEGPRLYVTTTGGVGRWDGVSWYHWFASVPCRLPGCQSDTTFLNPTYVFGVLAQSNGRKWVGSWDSAVETFTDASAPPGFVHLFVPVNSNDLADRKQTWIFSAFEDASGGVWFGLDTPVADDPSLTPLGLAQYDAAGNLVANWNTTNSTVAGVYIRSITQDKTGRMWIGFQDGGVESFPLPPTATSFTRLSDASSKKVRGLATYGDSLWVLSLDDLRLYSIHGDNPYQETWDVQQGQDQFALHPLAVATDGSVWAGSENGLLHFTSSGMVTYDHRNSPLASDVVRDVMMEPGTGRIWIGTSAGLQRFDPNYVPPAPPVVEALHVVAAPNPAFLTNLGPGVALLGDVPVYSVTIYDLTGRRVRHYDVVGAATHFWDGRDEGGTLVRPGMYFIKASAGGRSGVTRVILLH